MKKAVTWISIVTVIIFVIDWGVMGFKLLDHNYDIVVEAYIGLLCLLILFACAVFRLFTKRCPHCGKLRVTKGKYCPYCGKEI